MIPIEDDNSRSEIREFRPEDYEAVIALWEASDLPFKPRGRDTREALVRQSKDPTAIYLIAVRGGEIVGTVLGTHDGRKGWINRLAVSPRYQRRGIAAALLAETERRLASLGIEIFACLIEDGNDDSRVFFEKMGYEPFPGISYLTKRLHPGV